ncbi:MAG TPA: response regulator [Burkholderiales bacterium]|nr:response regulator [Burkholderiales bacterium]
MQNEPQVECPEAKSPFRTWRILFLDGAKNIERLKVTCKVAGHMVVGAHTIEEAWARLAQDPVDVIVCAAHLEEGSTFQFLQEVRRSKVHRNARFLILSLTTGAIGERLHRSTASAGMALGADAYAIMSVFDPEELVALIKILQLPVSMRQPWAPAKEGGPGAIAGPKVIHAS